MGLKYSDMRHSHYLNSTCDIGENKCQRDVTLQFPKTDMRHWGPSLKSPSWLRDVWMMYVHTGPEWGAWGSSHLYVCGGGIVVRLARQARRIQASVFVDMGMNCGKAHWNCLCIIQKPIQVYSLEWEYFDLQTQLYPFSECCVYWVFYRWEPFNERGKGMKKKKKIPYCMQISFFVCSGYLGLFCVKIFVWQNLGPMCL